MPRKKKSAADMTTKELAKRIFPPPVLDAVKKVVGKPAPKKNG